jgi:hypothetical protein
MFRHLPCRHNSRTTASSRRSWSAHPNDFEKEFVPSRASASPAWSRPRPCAGKGRCARHRQELQGLTSYKRGSTCCGVRGVPPHHARKHLGRHLPDHRRGAHRLDQLQRGQHLRLRRGRNHAFETIFVLVGPASIRPMTPTAQETEQPGGRITDKHAAGACSLPTGSAPPCARAPPSSPSATSPSTRRPRARQGRVRAARAGRKDGVPGIRSRRGPRDHNPNNSIILNVPLLSRCGNDARVILDQYMENTGTSSRNLRYSFAASACRTSSPGHGSSKRIKHNRPGSQELRPAGSTVLNESST